MVFYLLPLTQMNVNITQRVIRFQPPNIVTYRTMLLTAASTPSCSTGFMVYNMLV